MYLCHDIDMNKLLAIFIGLQIADLITTVIFLTMGVEESNPVVKFAIHHLGTFSGLLMIKSTGIALGIWWYKRGSQHGHRQFSIHLSHLLEPCRYCSYIDTKSCLNRYMIEQEKPLHERTVYQVRAVSVHGHQRIVHSYETEPQGECT